MLVSPPSPTERSIIAAALLCALLAVASFCFGGCAKQRAQYAADQQARHDAVSINLSQAAAGLVAIGQQFAATAGPVLEQAIEGIRANITKADKLNAQARAAVPAVADVPTAQIPPPAIDPKTLAEHPEADKVPPAPTGFGWGTIAAGATSVGLGACWLLARLAPLVRAAPLFAPYLAPFTGLAESAMEKAANAGYAALATKDQKAADAEAETLAGAARQLVPLVGMLRDAAPQLAPTLDHPLVQQALALLLSQGEVKPLPVPAAPVDPSPPIVKG